MSGLHSAKRRLAGGAFPKEREIVRTGRIFYVDGDQCVEVPDEFRFDAEEVYVRSGPGKGEITLSKTDLSVDIPPGRIDNPKR